MVASLLALEGSYCVTLGPQTPASEIVNAVEAHGMDIVVLSFSVIYPPCRIPPALGELRQRLASQVEIWAGGAGIARLKEATHDVRLMPALEDVHSALAEWRVAHPAQTGVVEGALV